MAFCQIDKHDHNVVRRGDFDLFVHDVGHPPRMIQDEGRSLGDVMLPRTVSTEQPKPTISLTAWPHANRGEPEDEACVYVGCRVPANHKLDKRTGKRRLACSRYCYAAHRQMVGAQTRFPYSTVKARAGAERRTMTRHRAPTDSARSQKLPQKMAT